MDKAKSRAVIIITRAWYTKSGDFHKFLSKIQPYFNKTKIMLNGRLL